MPAGPLARWPAGPRRFRRCRTRRQARRDEIAHASAGGDGHVRHGIERTPAALIARHAEGAHVHVQPCPGLADAIERGALSERAVSLWEQTPALFGAGSTVRVLSTGAPDTLQLLLRACPSLEAVNAQCPAI